MSQVQRVLLVARRELKDSLTDWRIVTPVALLTFLFPWVVMYSTRFGIGYAERYDPELVLARLIPFAAMIVGFFPVSFSLVIALESFVGEKERNTLEALLSTPITDGALYLGKLLAALALPLMGSLTAIAIFCVGLPMVTGQYVALDLLVQIVLLTFTLSLGMVAGAVVVSSTTTSVRAANLLSSFIVLPAMMMVSFQAFVILWEGRDALWYIAAAQALADLGLIRMGVRLFNREELLSRTIDRIDLRRTWRTFWSFVRQEPQAALSYQPSARLTLGRLYRRDIPQILRRGAGAVLLVSLVTLGAFGLGWAYARALPLPDTFRESMVMSPEQLRQAAGQVPTVLWLMQMRPWTIFSSNVRSLALFTLGGLISFGAAAVIPLFLAVGIIGFVVGGGFAQGMNPAVFLALFWPHGILELPAALIATAVGLRVGAGVLAPPQGFSLGDTLLQRLADFLKVFILLVMPLLLVAAFVEFYVTPQVLLWAAGG
jgi:ABC-type transport system involved in multi-copper enzyme maturation permease subunit